MPIRRVQSILPFVVLGFTISPLFLAQASHNLVPTSVHTPNNSCIITLQQNGSELSQTLDPRAASNSFRPISYNWLPSPYINYMYGTALGENALIPDALKRLVYGFRVTIQGGLPPKTVQIGATTANQNVPQSLPQSSKPQLGHSVPEIDLDLNALAIKERIPVAVNWSEPEVKKMTSSGTLKPFVFPSETEMQKELNPNLNPEHLRNVLGKEAYSEDLKREYVLLKQGSTQIVVVQGTYNKRQYYALDTRVLNNTQTSGAVAHPANARQTPDEFEILNWGPERYFWGQPTELDHYVPMRILAVDTKVEFDGLKHLLFAEYQTLDNSGELRRRQVLSLSPTEVQSLRSYPPFWDHNPEFGNLPKAQKELKGRNAAAQLFFRSLQPEEVKLLRLAEQFGLMVHGMKPNHLSRDPGARHDQAAYNVSGAILSPLIESTLLSSYDNKMNSGRSTNELRQNSLAWQNTGVTNWVEVFSSLTPEFVMREFGGAKAYNADILFTFVVTEDGQLMIAPISRGTGHNLEIQSRSLAGLRNIIVGGRFRFTSKAAITFELNSFGYDLNSGDTNVPRFGYHGNKNEALQAFTRKLFKDRLNLDSQE